MRKLAAILILAMLVFTMLATTAMAADMSIEDMQTAIDEYQSVQTEAAKDANILRLGYLTLLPPIVAIGLAFLTKNVVLSLFLGVMTGTFLISLGGMNFFTSIYNSFLLTTQTMLSVLTDSWNAGIILQVLAIGGLIALVTKIGGTQAIAEKLAAHAKGPVSAQVVTWLMGIVVFFDDYANSLIVGPVMRPVTDKLKVSRAKLAFIIDATAAPIAGIALISTWIGYEIGTIRDGFSQVANNAVIAGLEPYNLFVMTIPYRFYNIFILAFVFISALLLKEYGPMLKAERNARLNPVDPNCAGLADQIYGGDVGDFSKSVQKGSIWNAIIPLGALILLSFGGFYFNGYVSVGGAEALGGNPFTWSAIQECFGSADASIVLFQTALIAGAIAIIMGMWQKIFKLNEAIGTWVTGLKSLLITCVILTLAWSLSSTIKELGTAKFLVSALSDSVSPMLLPAIIFSLGSLISFATGTSYGTMGILMPLAIPFSLAMPGADMNYLVMCTGAVLTGAIFGDHCSPISDTTILSSMGASCDHIEHVNTQIWYAVTVAVITILFGYLPAALGLNVWITLLFGLAAVFCVIYFFGKKIDEPETVELKEAYGTNE